MLQGRQLFLCSESEGWLRGFRYLGAFETMAFTDLYEQPVAITETSTGMQFVLVPAEAQRYYIYTIFPIDNNHNAVSFGFF